ncbi:MAG: type II toxin-antitoxin system VapC family toxin [Solirubrobacterales bacterium]|nr:type II toxin-antitoxin system VapC family toxin [Solirubrobacterales bacterium]
MLLATDPAVRAARQARLAAVRDAYQPLPVDELVAERYGEVLAGARATRRITTATDLLIIATAAATGRVLYTLDERQARLAEDLGVATAR